MSKFIHEATESEMYAGLLEAELQAESTQKRYTLQETMEDLHRILKEYD